jgi:hypothetical protein
MGAADRGVVWASSLPVGVRVEIVDWGADGWSTPEWPYSRLYIRRTDRSHGRTLWTVEHLVEGDRQLRSFDEAADAVEFVQTHIHWGWSRGWATPDGFNADRPADEHCGPWVTADRLVLS